MHSLKVVIAAALLLPTSGLAQSEQTEPSAKAKAWMVSNYEVTITGVARDAPAGPVLLLVSTGKDLDGDGASDAGILRLVCTNGGMRAAAFQLTPADASGSIDTARLGGGLKRFRISKTIAGRKISLVNATVSELDQKGWTPVAVTGAGDLCDAAVEALTIPRSNVKNN